MSLFEKIYFTCYVITFIPFCIGMVIAIAGDEDTGVMLCEPFAIQVILTILYLVVKLTLRIWEIDLDWFPSIP